MPDHWQGFALLFACRGLIQKYNPVKRSEMIRLLQKIQSRLRARIASAMPRPPQKIEPLPFAGTAPEDAPGRIEEMVAELNRAAAIYRPSKFWTDLNKINVEQLLGGGFDHFKRTL